MKTPRHQVAAVLAKQTLAPSFEPHKFSRMVAAYLLDSGRTNELDSMLRDIVSDRAEDGIVEVVAVCAHPLQADSRKDIEKLVRARWPQAKQIIISEQLDPSVVGGVRLELPHAQLDLTVEDRLNRFKQLTTSIGD